jgi:hypothetical protein
VNGIAYLEMIAPIIQSRDSQTSAAGTQAIYCLKKMRFIVQTQKTLSCVKRVGVVH